MDYYLLCLKNTDPHLALWWRPSAGGYTITLDDAGIYSEEEAMRYHRPSDGVVAIPSGEVDRRVQRVVRVDHVTALLRIARVCETFGCPDRTEVGAERCERCERGSLGVVHVQDQFCRSKTWCGLETFDGSGSRTRKSRERVTWISYSGVRRGEATCEACVARHSAWSAEFLAKHREDCANPHCEGCRSGFDLLEDP